MSPRTRRQRPQLLQPPGHELQILVARRMRPGLERCLGKTGPRELGPDAGGERSAASTSNTRRSRWWTAPAPARASSQVPVCLTPLKRTRSAKAKRASGEALEPGPPLPGGTDDSAGRAAPLTKRPAGGHETRSLLQCMRSRRDGNGSDSPAVARSSAGRRGFQTPAGTPPKIIPRTLNPSRCAHRSLLLFRHQRQFGRLVELLEGDFRLHDGEGFRSLPSHEDQMARLRE